MADTKKPTINRALLVEAGVGGVRRSGGYIAADIIPRLNHVWQAARAFEEMRLNDPLMFGVDYALSMMTRRIKWRVEPNAQNKDSAAAKKAAKWLEAELFDRMTTPWADVIAEATSKFRHGFAPMEKTFIKRDDGSIGIDRVALRAQDTIERWEFDESGHVTGLWQVDPDRPRSVYIPAIKLLNPRTTPERGNPQGLSLMRGAYIYHVRQKAIEEAEARAALRAAGFVLIRVPPELLERGAGTEEAELRAQFEALGQALAEDRQGYALLSGQKDPEGAGYLYEIQYVTAGGQRSMDMTPIIERMEKRKVGSVLADFMLLGQQATGSFAMHEDKTTMFQEALMGFADIDEGEFNRHLVTQLWKLNGFPDETKPRLVHGQLTKPDLALVSDFVDRLIQRGLMSPTQELGDYLSDIAEVPRSTVAPPQPNQVGAPGAPGSGAPPRAALPAGSGKPTQTKPTEPDADGEEDDARGPGGARRPGRSPRITRATDDQ